MFNTKSYIVNNIEIKTQRTNNTNISIYICVCIRLSILNSNLLFNNSL